MQVANLKSRVFSPTRDMSVRVASTIAFIETYRKSRAAESNFELKRENIHAHEFAYLITDQLTGKFFVYGVVSKRNPDNTGELTKEDLAEIKKLIPEGQEYVDIVRGFDFEADEDNSEITVYLGDEWLFAILVDEELGCYTIERNEYLDRSSDIYTLIKTAGKAFRIARGY
ncbi:hypothetical protein D0726_004865 [Escherichia coli]|nr:hypothetical protein [Escherichia coli]